MSNEPRPFSPAELAHYSRQLGLAGFGPEGQRRLRDAAVLVVGVGGLGSPCAMYLAAAGVGRLGLVEFDRVDASNLHRQVLFGASQIGSPKLDCAAARLRDLNPHIDIRTYPERLTRSNARALVRDYDIVADGADNFPTRYLVNDACVLENRALVSASVLGFEGQLAVFHYRDGPCYRCLYPHPPPPGAVPSCAEGGVLGVLPGVLGSLQALETIKCLTGIGDPAAGRLVHVDALTLEVTSLKVPRNAHCPVCGDTPSVTELVDYEQLCAGPAARDTAGVTAREVTPGELVRMLAVRDDIVLVDVREVHERAIDAIDHSEHVPLASVLADGVPFASDRTIVVYCASGMRSLRAANHLLDCGYSDVSSLATGLIGFRAAGLP